MWCNESEGSWNGENGDAYLNIQIDAEESKDKEFMKNGEVEVDIGFDFVAMRGWNELGGFSDRESEKVLATIKKWEEGGFKITLKETNKGRDESMEVYCKSKSNPIEWLSGSERDTIIKNVSLKKEFGQELAGEEWRGNGKVESLVGTTKESKISIVKCSPEGNENNATCDLKLMDKTVQK